MAKPVAHSPTEAERDERVKVDVPFEDGLRTLLAVKPEDLRPDEPGADGDRT